jgi:Fe-S-cluster containining protein
VTEEEIRQIAEYKGLSLGEMQMHHLRFVGGRISLREYPNGDCTFLDGKTRKCSVYPARPAQCQTWPFWNSNLADEAAWKEAQASCPGAGCGKLYSLEQILTLADVVEI